MHPENLLSATIDSKDILAQKNPFLLFEIKQRRYKKKLNLLLDCHGKELIYRRISFLGPFSDR